MPIASMIDIYERGNSRPPYFAQAHRFIFKSQMRQTILLPFIRWERKRNGSKEMTEKLFYNFTLENKVESRIALQGNSKIQETTLRNISDRDL